MKRLWEAASTLMDATIAPAFGAPGFYARQKTWDPTEIPADLSDRVYVVTGANAGIGRAITTALAERGATVVMACRSRERAESARAEIVRSARTIADRLPIVEVDMASLDKVRAASDEIAERWSAIDALIHNAGMLVHERQRTEDGIEATLAVHVISPYAMTERLLPALRNADAGRLVFVASGGMYSERLDVEKLADRDESAAFDGVAAYARAKRAQVVLARGYAERLAPQVIAASMHPGWADTGGVRDALPRFHKLTKSFLRSPEQGADTAVWLAACPPDCIEPGRFYLDREPRTEHLPGMRTRTGDDEERALWALCARLAEG